MGTHLILVNTDLVNMRLLVEDSSFVLVLTLMSEYKIDEIILTSVLTHSVSM